MSDKPKFPAEVARKVADEILVLLKPLTERIEIVGSLRRGKPFVGDAELLFIPKFASEATGLFSEDNVKVNLTDAFINKLLDMGELEKRPSATGVTSWGTNNKLAIHTASGIPIDLFSTTEDNWWVSLVIRTGSKETNLRLTNGANRLGRTLNAYGCGVTCRKTGAVTQAFSEKSVFDLCGVPYLEPRAR